MNRAIVLWLLRWLQTRLDTDARARLADYERRKVEVEAQIEAARVYNEQISLAMAEAGRERDALRETLARRGRERDQLQEEIRRIESDTHEARAALSRMSDGDVLRLDL